MTIPCRGTIIKTPDSTPGLLMINGRQKPFVIEGMWKSSTAPAVNMMVDAEFDGAGSIQSVAVADPQQEAKEKPSQFGGTAQGRGYVEGNLGRGETVRYSAHVHWLVFAGPLIVGILGLLIMRASAGLGAFVIFVALVLGVRALLVRQTTELAVTNKRVVAKFGVISRKTIEQRLETVDSVQVLQGILGRLLGEGSVGIRGSGASQTPVPRIADPLRFRREVNDAIDDAKARPANQ